MADQLQIAINVNGGKIDNDDCVAGTLLTVYDRKGEAAMLNALHGQAPKFESQGLMTFADDSWVAYIPRLSCYSFGSVPRPVLHNGNALRVSVLHMGQPDWNEDLEQGHRILKLTQNMVLAAVIPELARRENIFLPDDFTPHHGLVLHLVPEATRSLYEVLEWLEIDPDHRILDEKIQEITELLARRLIMALPEDDVDRLKMAIDNLVAGYFDEYGMVEYGMPGNEGEEQ